jgi:hypothetical protein
MEKKISNCQQGDNETKDRSYVTSQLRHKLRLRGVIIMYKAANIKYYGNVPSCALITWHATRINVACAVAIIKL